MMQIQKGSGKREEAEHLYSQRECNFYRYDRCANAITSMLAAVLLRRGDSQSLHLPKQSGLVDPQRSRCGNTVKSITFKGSADRLSIQNIMR
jgi:hypothetical protein